MLVIRAEQMNVLYDSQLARWLSEYLQSCYPARANRLGPAGVIAFCTRALKKARKRGLADAEEIRKYVHVAFLFGASFDTELSWAADIMNDRHYKSTLARMRVLEDAALQHLTDKRVEPKTPDNG